MSSGPQWWKLHRKGPIGEFFMIFLVLSCPEWHFSTYYMKSTAPRPSEGEYTFFELLLLCYFAPLKHCAEAIELSEELCKVLAQLPCTISSCRTRSHLRRLRSEFKGVLLTILLFEALAIRAWGPIIDALTLHYVCSCCEEPFGVDFIEMGSSVNELIG